MNLPSTKQVLGVGSKKLHKETHLTSCLHKFVNGINVLTKNIALSSAKSKTKQCRGTGRRLV